MGVEIDNYLDANEVLAGTPEKEEISEDNVDMEIETKSNDKEDGVLNVNESVL